jgi:hypothetical protein
MRRLSFIIGLIFLLFSTACFHKNIVREDAKRIIIDEIVMPSTLDHDVLVFLTAHTLQRGDRISPKGFPDETDVIKGATWFAWIDDEPEAEFEHDTRFIYLNARSGRYKVKVRQWYPVLNDTVVLWQDVDKWISHDLLIFAQPPFHFHDVKDDKPNP